MRASSAFPMVTLLTALVTGSGVAAADGESPDADADEAPPAVDWSALGQPVDPHAFSTAIRSEVTSWFTLDGITLLFQPSMDGLSFNVSGYF